MRRVSVVGNVGSGKTTFARALAARLNVPHIELDALHWGPGWTPASAPVMRERVGKAIAGYAWVVDGSYLRKIGALVWSRADTVVWLDPPRRDQSRARQREPRNAPRGVPLRGIDPALCDSDRARQGGGSVARSCCC